MKKISLLLLLLVASVATFANEPIAATKSKKAEVKLFVSADSKVNLLLEKDAITALVILRDASGQVYDSKFVNLKKGTSKFIYDVSALNNGTYQFEISKGKEVIKKKLVVESKPTQVSVSIQ